MSHALIVSIDIADTARQEFEGWLRADFLSARIEGIATDPTCYRGIEVVTKYRHYLPSPSYVVIFDFTEDPGTVVESDEFIKWWTAGVAARICWVTTQNWVVAERSTGLPLPFDAEKALITQVHFPPEHQEGWARWYDNVHIAQSLQVENLFLKENRRFSAVDIVTRRWQTSSRPRFTHMVPIRQDADIAAAMATPEYLSLISDTQSRFAGAIETARSTLFERFR